MSPWKYVLLIPLALSLGQCVSATSATSTKAPFVVQMNE